MTSESATKRPRTSDQDVIDEAAIGVAGLLKSWLSEHGESEAEEYLLENAKEILKFCSAHDDGYSLAKRAEDIGYCSDSSLVDYLDGAWMIVREALTKKTMEWVKAEDRKPSLEINAKIKAKEYDIKRSPFLDGIIVGVNNDEGMYTVCIPSLGHTPPGAKPKNPYSITTGSIFAWEVVESWQEEFKEKEEQS